MTSRLYFPAMCRGRALSVLFSVLLLQSVVALVSAQGSNTTSRWQTLSGNAPLVIARGGFSGLFPDSSYNAYSLALLTSATDVVLWCDVKLTKDGAGICVPELNLNNGSDISAVFKNKDKIYLVNGVPTRGWFSIDFTLNDLLSVYLNQGIYTRTNKFDGNLLQILTVEDVARQLKPPGFWLNIQYDTFFTQHNLSMRSFVINVSRNVVVNYISSPEVAFLSSIATRFNSSTTKLVFRFLKPAQIEPSTNQTYGSLLTNLTFIKTFASGILVPKDDYIWPVDELQYLKPYTSLVSDAHKEGLEVFASDFVNDLPLSYNYSYDPVTEYLNFIDNGAFSVDGVLSDFPITASVARDCVSHLGRNASERVPLLVISMNGASGDYPGCTDKAYTKAISDGVDVLDCSVQMTMDGTPVCLSSINLIESTNVAQTNFSDRTMNVPVIKSGIFTFSLTWSEIQTLEPVISSPYSRYTLYRNPKFKNDGKFLTLSDFLALANDASSLTGVLLSIEHAAYLAESQSLGVTDAVLDALSKSGFNQTPKKVMIQSTNSAVLMKFKEISNYKLVYKIDEPIRDALNSTVEDIKKFADSVVVGKESVFPENEAFITGVTDVVPRLQSFNLSVYVETFSNEFVSQAWDFFSDGTVEINSYYLGANINGVITGFPKTAARYKRNRCVNRGTDPPAYMTPVEPGSLIQLVTAPYLPPAEAPSQVLTESDIMESPLPSVPAKVPAPNPNDGSTAVAPTPPNGQPKIATCIFLSYLAVLLATLLLL